MIEAETGYIYKPRDTKIARNQEQIGRGKEGPSPRAFTESMALPADTLVSDL